MVDEIPAANTTAEVSYNLLHHLSTEKPELRSISSEKGGGNTRNQRWRYPTETAAWEDFNCDSLMQCCDGLFREMLKEGIEPMTFPHLDRDVVRFANESALEKHYISQWMHPIIATGLFHAQSRSSKLQLPFVEMVAGGNAFTPSKWIPDWAGTRTVLPNVKSRTLNILPGDTKLSRKWQSSWIVAKQILEEDTVREWFWPLRQIFTYCLSNNTRYGYIITDEEVVVFRVRAPLTRLETVEPGQVTGAQAGGTLEFSSVRDSTQEPGSRRMTMNLAIWWLHLLAANNPALSNEYGPLKDERLDGLLRVPDPPGSMYRPSPTPTVTTYNSFSDADQIITSPHSMGPPTFSSFASSVMSFGSTSSAHKRKRHDGPSRSSKKRR